MPTKSTPKAAARPAKSARSAANAPPQASQVDPPASGPTLAAFRPLASNPNNHTPRGLSLLEDAIQQDGYVAPMTAAADGTILDGNARLETVAHVLPTDPIVIHHDGRRPIIAVRTDIPNADDARARRIAIAANRIAALDLEWNPDALREMQQSGVDLSPFWSEAELTRMLGVAPPSFKAFDETLETEHVCPKCGYRWSGASADEPKHVDEETSAD